MGEKKKKSSRRSKTSNTLLCCWWGVLGQNWAWNLCDRDLRIDLSLSKPSYLEIHNSYSSACSFSSYFFFQQHQLCLSVSFSLTQWHLWQNSAARGSCPTPPRQRADEFTGTSFNSSQCICNVPSASCCTFWSCTLCNPDMLMRLISNCIFIPGCYHDIILRKCSGKINFYSSVEMFLYCLISDFR